MIPVRLLIFGFPLLVVALAWWAARETRRSRAEPGDGVVVMLPQEVPALNPFLPATEAEREIMELVHAPLIRTGADGTLQPALAELWNWTQEVTCWFADEPAAARVQEVLQAQIGENNRWAEWHLSSARVAENSLLLSFSDPAATGVRQALESLAGQQPLPVTFWRIERRAPLRQAWEQWQEKSAQAGLVQRVWFDGEHACEIVVAGAAQLLFDDLRRTLDADDSGQTTVQQRGEAFALSEPVLDLDIRPGQTWHDGTPVTAADAKATLEFLRARDWPLPNRETLRHVQAVEVQNDGARLHVTLRRRYGPALCLWADLPVLPAAWLEAHAQDADTAFTDQPPPGAGTHRLVAHEARSLILLPRDVEKARLRFLLNFAASPLMTQIGLSTHTVDLVWPAAAAGQAHLNQMRFTPPRQRVVVLWNTRHELLGRAWLREALALATDTNALIRALPGRHGLVDGSIFPPGLWFSTQAEHTPFDLKQARQVLAAADQPRPAGRELAFSLLIHAGNPLHEKTARQLVAQWTALGVRVAIETVPDDAALAQRLVERRFDAVLLDQRYEVSWDQLPWWHSSQAEPGGTNFSGIADPQVDLQLEALAVEFDPAHVPARVRDLDARLRALRPMLALFTRHEEVALSPSLQQQTAAGSAAWTLRALTMPPKRAMPAPAIELKLRSPE